MKTFPIAINDIRIQKGPLAMMLPAKALDKGSTQTPHSSQDVSFAGILNRRKESASTPAPILDKKNPATNDPDSTEGLIGKPVAADAPPKTKHTKGLTVLSPLEDSGATPADSLKSPVSILIDEMSFSAFADPAFTKAPEIETPAAVHMRLALAGSEFSKDLDAAVTNPDAPRKDGPATLDKPADSEFVIASETKPSHNSLIGKEIAAAHMRPALTGSEFSKGLDAAVMNSEAPRKDGQAAPGKTPDSEFVGANETKQSHNSLIGKETATAHMRPALTGSESSKGIDRAVMNPEAPPKDGQATPGKAPDSERTDETRLAAEPADEDRMVRNHPLKDARLPVESKFTDRVANLLLQKEGSPAPENILSQAGRTVVAARNDNPSALSPKAAAPHAAPQNPATVGNSERDSASRPGFLDRAESAVELPDRAVAMKERGATVTGYDANSDKSRPMILTHAANPAERELFGFRPESFSTVSSLEAKAPLYDSPAGSRTQAIINQIIDAKQAMNGDFGRIRIVLSPPNLGTVDLEIVVRNERVEVVMKADNSSVQQALQSRADDIRVALQRHDLKIEAFQVLLQDQEANRQHQSQGGALFEQRRENQAAHDFRDDSPMLSAAPSLPSLSSLQGARPEKGRVSIFI